MSDLTVIIDRRLVLPTKCHRCAVLQRLVSIGLATLLALSSQSSLATEVTDAVAPFSANGTLRVAVTIGGFLRFRVGAIGATINLLTFSPLAANVGNATPLVGAGGDVVASTVNVLVQGNRSQITITPTNSSAGLGIGTGVASDGRISYGQISTASSDAINLPAPVLSNAGGSAALPVLSSGSGSTLANNLS